MLTRNEIIELRARVIYNTDNQTSVNWIDYYDQTTYIDLAKATIEADEKAGVLMLVDDEPKLEDIIKHCTAKTKYGYAQNLYEIHEQKDWQYFQERGDDIKIIQRNNTPVYQCKKEVTNDQQ